MALQDDFSSKLKRVFVELHNYSYYHGPSDNKQPDSRFIGRKRQIEKLRSVLTDTEKKSGTYLIAGYRGMGKTSYVNKVLELIYSPVTFFSKLIYFIFLHLVIFISCIFLFFSFSDWFKLCKHNEIVIYFSIILFIIATLIYSYRRYKNYILFKKISSKKHLQWVDWFVLVFMITSTVLFCICIDKSTDLNIFNKSKITYSVSLLFLLILTGLIKFFVHFFKNTQTQLYKKQNYISSIFIKFKQFINYSDRIIIKLNLGYSNLHEIDILRLISRNILIQYKSYQRTFSFNGLLRAIIIFCILIIARISWNPISESNFYHSFLQNSGISTIFPSQQRIFHENNSLLKIAFNDLNKNQIYSVSNYICLTQYLNWKEDIYKDKNNKNKNIAIKYII
jgi:hypothetical protein